MILARYACDPGLTRGRRYPEVHAPTRSDFQRDRDRIVHSTAFRRLVYKTQVFLNHEGDLFRTRLTHSLEVAQLGRSIARTLQLNEDLVEAIALAHDLGHTPFGHAGQDALNACLLRHNSESAGFEHNLQSLRVVDALEECYPAYNGLNLSFETREGILKHCSRRNARHIEAREPGGVAHRFLEQPPGGPQWRQPSLEAQLANLADEIAYNASILMTACVQACSVWSSWIRWRCSASTGVKAWLCIPICVAAGCCLKPYGACSARRSTM